ncbi:MAG: 23S rRNA (pseudouridine(1915)-N(3))-methyltransferase RlmH [Clostridia bacterium]|nr:23S rRNA (pseudouridine(1915)-N(3))-methyltransferase RlmH [Clostridia bacterium]MDD4048852.1 23S rRNA (pseudouridine(1915)-N(3))-methyltransferase RlmH [Clostridia bacterium]
MRIKVVVVGKLKEKYWKDAVKEYLKRLEAYAKVEIVEVDEERLQDNPSSIEIEKALAKEEERINRHISQSSFVIPLAIEGKMVSSQELSSFMGKLAVEGKSDIAFIIGSSHGISREIIREGDCILSFSKMTFPHQMMRVILLEQIYRAFKIMKGEPYHK